MADLREDKAQIAEVLIRYATGIDQRDWALFRTCWTADVEADYGTVQHAGVEAITEYMTRAHENMGPTHHRLSNVVVDVEGDRASARSYVHAVLMLSPDDPGRWIDVIGNYTDELVRTPAGWRISRRTTRIARLLTSGETPVS
ncbi:nuclear transport factor 2 family protein [Parafrankia sp. FMc2]|uniref:nuclear transport factor 2 family protein n=1 Tax=Parafrankia sp. FMc2 TaxID=3233196 RepID=UPI0034D6711B